MTTDRQFQSVGIGYNTPSDVDYRAIGQGIKIGYLVSENAIRIEVPSGLTTKYPSSAPQGQPFVSSAAYGNPDYSPSSFSFKFTVPEIHGVKLSYLRFATITDESSGPPAAVFDELFFGYPTAADNMPHSGTATYNAAVIGQITSPQTNFYEFTNAAAQFSADFFSGTLKTDIQGKGVNWLDPNDAIDLGTESGSGQIDSGGPGFHGTFGNSGYPDGKFVGAFFGPAAAEMGYTFFLSKNGYTWLGGVYGTKN